MAKHHNKRGEQRDIGKRVSTLEREVKEMRAKTPIDPAQAMNMAVARKARAGERPDFIRTTRGNANFETPVRDHLARLQGRSTSHVASDKDRGARSPLTERRRRK
jgi:hypothetical protein